MAAANTTAINSAVAAAAVEEVVLCCEIDAYLSANPKPTMFLRPKLAK